MTKDEEKILESELSAKVELNQDGIYYISGESVKMETATVSEVKDSKKVSVGSAEDNFYTVNPKIKQNIIYSGDAWTIEGISDYDTVTADNGKSDDVIFGEGVRNSINSGAGNDSINISGNRNTIFSGDGDDTIENISSRNYIDGGDGDNFFYFGSGTKNTVVGGSGSDTFSVNNDTKNTLTIKNLDYDDVIILSSPVDEIEVDEENNSMTAGDLTIIFPNTEYDLINSFQLSDGNILTSDYERYIGKVFENDTPDKIIRATKKDDTITNTADNVTIDAKDGYDKIINSGDNVSIFGGQGKDTIENSGDNVIIIADTGKDVIKNSGSNVSIDGGKGKNQISLSADSENNLIYFSGKNTVEGFKTGFDNGADKIYISGNSPAVDFKDDGLTFYTDGEDENEKSLTLKDVHNTSKVILSYENGDENREVFIADDDIYKVVDGEAKYYVGASAGKNHGISFEGIAESIDVTLNTSYSADTDFWINNVHSIVGGDYETKITGSAENDTIIGGTGKNTLNGRAGDDILIGNGTTEYYYTSGNGQDTIQNFSSSRDKLFVSGKIKNYKLRGSNVVINMNDGSSGITLKKMAGNSFKISVNGTEHTAKVARNSVIYDGKTDYYAITGGNASIRPASNVEKVDIWLNQEVGEEFGNTVQIYGDIKCIRGSYSPDVPNVLVGAKKINNIIYAGQGNSSLWGGGASSDTLIGGFGEDTFFYTKGSGKDTIKGANSNDIVDLSGMKLSDISSINIADNSISLNFKGGGNLFLNTNAGTKFLLNGYSYIYDKSVGDWHREKL